MAYVPSAQCGLVAQIWNLPYRRFGIGRASASSSALALTDLPQNTILRYSRLQICAALNTYQAGSLPHIFRQALNLFIFSFLLFDAGSEESLIRKRRQHRDHRHADERADAIELVELGQVVEEEFEQRQAQQPQRGVA